MNLTLGLNKIKPVNGQEKDVFVEEDAYGNKIPMMGYTFSININIKEIARDVMINLYKEYKLNDLPLREIKQKTAFIRAVKLANTSKNFLHEVQDTDLEISYQFDEKFIEELNGELHAKFSTKSIIHYIKADDRIVCEDSEVLKIVIEKIGWAKLNYRKVDIAKAIYMTMEAGNTFEKEKGPKFGFIVPERWSGGTYFVPARFHDLLFNLVAMLKKMDPTGSYPVRPIPDMAYVRESVERNMEEKHADLLKIMEEKIDKLNSEGNKISDTIYKNMLDDISKLNKLIEMEGIIVESQMLKSKQLVKDVREHIKNYRMFGKKTLELQDKKAADAIPEHIKEMLGL